VGQIKKLKSYVAGAWVEGGGTILVNPATEEPLADAGTSGVDFKAAMEHARREGNPALRSMTFAQRGDLIGKIASALHGVREELIELSIASGGNTRGDAKFDIDGAIGTLAHYAELAKKLGDRRWLLDGEEEPLGRSPRFAGRHILTPFAGAAVHINAFNFPAWGFGEKAAVALLAGMPVITKPATSTALLAYRIMEVVIGAGILPPGALQFICGGVGDLLDHLTCQDVLSFTGSSETARTLRVHPAVVRNSVRLNVEADSLNAAVLGPDVDRESKTYDLFLLEVVREMTQKAGQKCTAVRRIFAPAGLVEQVRDDLIAQIRSVKVGNPAAKEVRMGPLATRAQMRDVLAGIDRLAARAKPVLGNQGRGPLVDVPEGKGYFVSPTLFHAADARASEIHDREIFGPVQTLMGYSGKAEEASALVNLGSGGLVSSVYTDDREFAAEMVARVAPYHGRIHLGCDKIADASLGSGAVLPQMMHGGPGRAGGGAELGGLRGMSFYLQTTAVQGLKPLLEKIL
jgi:oxepin-CoA hydrolase/3-oxo-5,6-dehydrosuberyl-CoA semialdehyde dehydrogenase